jgi:hypothetical protein
MAKTSKSLTSMDSIFSELDKVNPFATNDFANVDVYKNDIWLDSGNWILNAALSGSIKKGFPGTKISALAGESGCLPKEEKILIYIMKTSNYEKINSDYDNRCVVLDK